MAPLIHCYQVAGGLDCNVSEVLKRRPTARSCIRDNGPLPSLLVNPHHGIESGVHYHECPGGFHCNIANDLQSWATAGDDRGPLPRRGIEPEEHMREEGV